MPNNLWVRLFAGAYIVAAIFTFGVVYNRSEIEPVDIRVTGAVLAGVAWPLSAAVILTEDE